jgi:ribosomal protein S18 acetylase RimI-like enzyme
MDEHPVAEIQIRLMTADDTDAVAEMWLALVAYHRGLSPDLPDAVPGGEHRYIRRLLERLEDPTTCVLVAEHDHQVVGYILGMVVDLMQDIFEQQPGGFLADIYVEPDYRRRGVGGALVGALRAWFRQQDITFFDWHVATHNPEGLAFWKAVGGREVMLRMRADV